ncbi:MAG: hypothetical protein ACON5B_11730 [Myxococcota bacterium]
MILWSLTAAAATIVLDGAVVDPEQLQGTRVDAATVSFDENGVVRIETKRDQPVLTPVAEAVPTVPHGWLLVLSGADLQTATVVLNGETLPMLGQGSTVMTALEGRFQAENTLMVTQQAARSPIRAWIVEMSLQGEVLRTQEVLLQATLSPTALREGKPIRFKSPASSSNAQRGLQ